MEVEKKHWKMSVLDANYHHTGYSQKKVKSKGKAVRNGMGKMGAGDDDAAAAVRTDA
jgi:hypothetical protein